VRNCGWDSLHFQQNRTKHAEQGVPFCLFVRPLGALEFRFQLRQRLGLWVPQDELDRGNKLSPYSSPPTEPFRHRNRTIQTLNDPLYACEKQSSLRLSGANRPYTQNPAVERTGYFVLSVSTSVRVS
jgi:hypothetical protein